MSKCWCGVRAGGKQGPPWPPHLPSVVGSAYVAHLDSADLLGHYIFRANCHYVSDERHHQEVEGPGFAGDYGRTSGRKRS